MAPRILDGTAVSKAIRAEVAGGVAELAARGIVPGLAVVLVGDHPASAVYVASKGAAAREAGITERTLRFPADLQEESLLRTVAELNADDAVDAILVQLPLPKHIDSARVLEAIDPHKDVDGFHPVNAGRLLQGKPAPVPCTPAGILELLKREGVPLRGTRAVIVGRSDIVGKPTALLLLRNDATVTIAHSKTRDLPGLCREADLLVAAIGRPGFVTGEFVKEGAILVDVGINRVTSRRDVEKFFPGDATRMALFEKKGSTLVGDCDPATAFPRSSRYTPVPGGVGPLTISMLLRNTLELCRGRRALSR
ncbi:MAG TPA: bifunctional 5,10-methylenetetrahydrofolate dehydrogenase/5,10-methenyltetrahydrofolate cyclohydrolase [Thermoanaerobaculia bacterium]|nr:bifunctional 5,10-methylenetetrahydrofolate dehydrogenase/5,10-methenyltetrahydrofolate cyclohydrolase [Thermoanaerobaculia bacterium]